MDGRMKVILTGGEKGTYRNLLVEQKVPRIALNVTQYSIPKTKAVNLKELLGGADVTVYCSEGDEDVDRYDRFIRDNHEEITNVIGRPDYDGTWLGEKYIPLWNDADDLERLAFLCERYGRVAISDKCLNPTTIKRIRQLQQRWGCVLVAITSKIDSLEAVEWDMAVVSSWTSVVRYGETQVWDGHGIRRYSAQKKESARKRHRADIVRLGLDFDAVMEDDSKELAKLAILSWMAWDKHEHGAYHPQGDADEEEFDTNRHGAIVTMPAEMANSPKEDLTPSDIATDSVQRRHESEKMLLPGMGLEETVSVASVDGEDADQSIEVDPHIDTTIKYSSNSVRNCDSCYLASRCPQFKEHADCAYKLPVELKTKEQLSAALQAMLEMQTSRILFARFAEELEGQGVDPTVSQEMDRLFRLVKEFKDIKDTRELVRFEMETRGGSGVISRLFGSSVGEKAQTLEAPLTMAELDQAVIDAEVLDTEGD
jgi:hypothetical protein